MRKAASALVLQLLALVVIFPATRQAFSPPSRLSPRRWSEKTSLHRLSTAVQSSPTEQQQVVTTDIAAAKTMNESSSAAAAGAAKTVTERVMTKCAKEAQATGAGGVSTWEAFQRAEANWSRLKSMKASATGGRSRSDAADTTATALPPPPFVTDDAALGKNPQCWTKLRQVADGTVELDYDIVVCGGTLGVFFALALTNKGHNVCVLEAGQLRGREQEWNISMEEMLELVEMDVLTKEDVDACIMTEFPGCRSGFKNKEVTPLSGGYFENKEIGYECFTPNVLNLGISPKILIERVAQRFQSMGGTILQDTRLQGVAISESTGAALDLGGSDDDAIITAQLVLDCMGNASPISRQQRFGEKPDGICAVVGSCAAGYDPETNRVGDIIYTNSPIQDKETNGKYQYFWESFPVGIGRNGIESSNVKTTYMFTYMDADEDRVSLETLMEDYWKMLPVYQPSIEDPEKDLDVKRVLFAYFPTYTDSPIQPKFSRVLPVGDASGIQSPLSFGGFGALTRHLDRITTAVDEALTHKLTNKQYLGAINAYTPNLSAAWMFQKAMSVKMGQNVDEKFVNRLLAVNFQCMDKLGQRTIKPFLQDVIRFDGLVASLAQSFTNDPMFMPEIVLHIGLPRLVDWLGHVAMMGYYELLHNVASPVIRPFVDDVLKDPAQQYIWRRRMDAWKFGSGNDYSLPEEN